MDLSVNLQVSAKSSAKITKTTPPRKGNTCHTCWLPMKGHRQIRLCPIPPTTPAKTASSELHPAPPPSTLPCDEENSVGYFPPSLSLVSPPSTPPHRKPDPNRNVNVSPTDRLTSTNPLHLPSLLPTPPSSIRHRTHRGTDREEPTSDSEIAVSTGGFLFSKILGAEINKGSFLDDDDDAVHFGVTSGDGAKDILSRAPFGMSTEPIFSVYSTSRDEVDRICDAATKLGLYTEVIHNPAKFKAEMTSPKELVKEAYSAPPTRQLSWLVIIGDNAQVVKSVIDPSQEHEQMRRTKADDLLLEGPHQQITMVNLLRDTIAGFIVGWAAVFGLSNFL